MTQKTNVTEGSSGETGRSPGGTGELVQGVKDLAGDAAGQARKLAESRLATPRGRAADALKGVAKTLREAGGKIDAPPGIELDRYVSRAADGVERASAYLRDRELRDVVRDVEGYARREPAMFFGGAFVLGLVASRFLKSSTPGSRSARAQPGEWSRPREQNGERPRLAQPAGPSRPSPTGGGLSPATQPSSGSFGETSSRSTERERSGRPGGGAEGRKNPPGAGAFSESGSAQPPTRSGSGGGAGSPGDKPSSKA